MRKTRKSRRRSQRLALVRPSTPAVTIVSVFITYFCTPLGPRACIGRKFATTEAVCFLAMLLRDWKVEPVLLEGETPAQWRQRVMQAKLVMALAMDDVPLKLTMRERPGV